MIFQVRFANFDYSVSPEPPSVATVGALPTVGAYPARGLVLAIRRSDSPYYVVSPCFAITKRLLPYCDLRFVDSKGHSRFVLRISIIVFHRSRDRYPRFTLFQRWASAARSLTLAIAPRDC